MSAFKFVCIVAAIAAVAAVGLSLCDIAKDSEELADTEEKNEWDKFWGH